MAILEARNITKTFQEGRQSVTVLDGVTLELELGEIVSLEGPSGSGKTTLLSIAGCILSPTSGEIEIEGRVIDTTDASALVETRRRSLGFVFQQFNLFPSLTAVQNVEYSLNVRRVGGVEARREAIRVIEAVGLGSRQHFLPRDLSGGQKQRVAIARALAGRAPVILADEPTANLDSHAGMQVLEMFRDLAKQQERALLIVTHDPKVRRVADRVLEIRDGRILATDEEPELAVASAH